MTKRTRLEKWVLGILVLSSCGLPGCRRFRARGGSPPPLAPPIEPYVPGEWKSFDGHVRTPPEAALHPWRVMVLQEVPRPKKNPRFRAIPVEEGGLLDMPQESRFRCLYAPASFRAFGNERFTAVEKWDVVRTVRCSSDGWHTYSQAAFAVTVSADGQAVAKTAEQAELYLSETVRDKPLRITIVLRPD